MEEKEGKYIALNYYIHQSWAVSSEYGDTD